MILEPIRHWLAGSRRAVADQLNVKPSDFAHVLGADAFVYAVNPVYVGTLNTHRYETINIIGKRKVPPGVGGDGGRPSGDKRFWEDLVDCSLQRLKCRGSVGAMDPFLPSGTEDLGC